MRRRTFLANGARAIGLAPFLNIVVRPSAGAPGSFRSARGMNLLVILTDQERATQHFPARWDSRLRGQVALQKHGLTFSRAFCCAAMCTPSRASLMTGLFPAQHMVKDTLTEGFALSETEQILPTSLPNLGSLMGSAGYEVVYKGKWHLNKPLADRNGDGLITSDDWAPADVEPYGFTRWEAPDAGEDIAIENFGGGDANNDRRFVTGRDATGKPVQEGVLDYLDDVAQRNEPFCLFVSLVNPHDVLAYPKSWKDGGYSAQWLRGPIDLPETIDEDLSTKPTAQRLLLPQLQLGLGPLVTPRQQRAYLNFYGNLIQRSDAFVRMIMRKLKRLGLLDTTLVVRTSDHGEMGLAHGGLRQKTFNFYEETMRVPLIFSNPRLFPGPRTSDTLVSHVDLVPTLASLFEVPGRDALVTRGIDYSSTVLSPAAPPPQDHVLFTFDDVRAGQDTDQVVPPPNRIQAIREGRYKLARFYDVSGQAADQWEFYDLNQDPLERINLAHPGAAPSADQQAQRVRLTEKLQEAVATRLQPL